MKAEITQIEFHSKEMEFFLCLHVGGNNYKHKISAEQAQAFLDFKHEVSAPRDGSIIYYVFHIN